MNGHNLFLPFVGRKEDLDNIEKWIKHAARSQSGLRIYIIGPGGIGKTRLLRTLEETAKLPGWSVSNILDLNNPEAASSPLYFLRSILLSVAGLDRWAEFQHPEIRDLWREVINKQQDPRASFEDIDKSLRNFEKRVLRYIRSRIEYSPGTLLIIRIDGLEWLDVIKSDAAPVQSEEVPSLPKYYRDYCRSDPRTWLYKHFLPLTKYDPIVWAFSYGKEEGRHLYLPSNSYLPPFQMVELRRFSKKDEKDKEEIMRYFFEVIKRLDDDGKRKRVWNLVAKEGHSIPKEFEKEVFNEGKIEYILSLTKGTPLYLALLVATARFFQEEKYKKLLEEDKNLKKEDLQKIEDLLRLWFNGAGKEDTNQKSVKGPESKEGDNKQGSVEGPGSESIYPYLAHEIGLYPLGVSEETLKSKVQEWKDKHPKAPEQTWAAIEHELTHKLGFIKAVRGSRWKYQVHDVILDKIQAFIGKERKQEVATKAIKEIEREREKVVNELRSLPFSRLGPRQQIVQEIQRLEIYKIFYQIWEDPWKAYPAYFTHVYDWRDNRYAKGLLFHYLKRLERWDKENTFWSFWEKEHLLYGEHHDPIEKEKDFGEYRELLSRILGLREAYSPRKSQDQKSSQTRILKESRDIRKKIEELEGPNSQNAGPVSQDILSIFSAIVSNYEAMALRRQGHFCDAKRKFQEAIKTYRRQRMEGTAGILINLAYLDALFAHFRTAADHLKEARRLLGVSANLKDYIRLQNIATFLYGLWEDLDSAEKAAREALDASIAEPSHHPRFRAWILIHWARALRGEWNSHVSWGRDLEEGVNKFLFPALRLLLPKTEVLKTFPEDTPSLKLWERPYHAGWEKTAWELRDNLLPEEKSELYREIGRLWRELGWARLQQGLSMGKPLSRIQNEIEPIMKASADALWMAATGDNAAPTSLYSPHRVDHLPKQNGDEELPKWWNGYKEKVEHYIREIENAYFYPIAAMIDIGWHYHYLARAEDIPPDNWAEHEGSLCKWIRDLFPKNLSLPSCTAGSERSRSGGGMGSGSGGADPQEASSEFLDDPRLFGQLGKLHMLGAHAYLRAWRKRIEASEREKLEELFEISVAHLLLAFQYNEIAGGDSPYMRRCEANLYDWLMKHGWETVRVSQEETTLLNYFVEATNKNAPDIWKCLLSKVNCSSSLRVMPDIWKCISEENCSSPLRVILDVPDVVLNKWNEVQEPRLLKFLRERFEI